jgi:hypothetical protein
MTKPAIIFSLMNQCRDFFSLRRLELRRWRSFECDRFFESFFRRRWWWSRERERRFRSRDERERLRFLDLNTRTYVRREQCSTENVVDLLWTSFRWTCRFRWFLSRFRSRFGSMCWTLTTVTMSIDIVRHDRCRVFQNYGTRFNVRHVKSFCCRSYYLAERDRLNGMSSSSKNHIKRTNNVNP